MEEDIKRFMVKTEANIIENSPFKAVPCKIRKGGKDIICEEWGNKIPVIIFFMENAFSIILYVEY